MIVRMSERAMEASRDEDGGRHNSGRVWESGRDGADRAEVAPGKCSFPLEGPYKTLEGGIVEAFERTGLDLDWTGRKPPPD